VNDAACLSIFAHCPNCCAGNLAQISDPAYPGERLIACRNPLMAAERTRQRNELLAATERALNEIAAPPSARAIPCAARPHRIARRRCAGPLQDAQALPSHDREETGFSFTRDDASIAREAALDGIYVIRTGVSAAALASDEGV
jgi:hypothetical protein